MQCNEAKVQDSKGIFSNIGNFWLSYQPGLLRCYGYLAAPEILHDEPITDRKSTFQAHVARVTDVDEVYAVMRSLLENKKIASATHNIQVRTTLNSFAIKLFCDETIHIMQPYNKTMYTNVFTGIQN